MTYGIRHTLALLPLGLALAGCGGPERRESSSDRRPARSARTEVRPRPVEPDRRESWADARPAPRRAQTPAKPVAIVSRYDVTLEEIRGHQHNHTAVFMDAREPAAFNQGHLRGATNLPSSQKENYAGRIRQDVANSQFIIIYCNGPQCAAADTVYDYLTGQGFTNMRVFKPGWGVLASAKYLQ